MGTRAAAAPEFLLRLGSTGRIEQDYKTRRQCRGEHSRGRATSPWPTAASSSRTSPSEQPEPVAREDQTISANDDPWFLRGATGGFFLAVSTSRGGLRPSSSPRVHIHRRWEGIGGRGTAVDRGRRGGSCIMITKGGLVGGTSTKGGGRNGDAHSGPKVCIFAIQRSLST